MRILAVLMAVIPFSFAFHAVKTGRGAMWVGRGAEADALFAAIVGNARRSALESEQEWVKLARAERETTAA